MSEGAVHLEINGPIATITFDRQPERNAMTWAMYGQLGVYCEQLRKETSVRAVIFRGAGGKAFVAGTDIAQFLEFKDGDDGVAYEKQIDVITGMLEALPMPTIALIEGWAVGGGLAIATTCDFRIATPESKLGVPIARTLGNCLSMNNYSLLVAQLGPAVTLDVLLRARLLTGEEAAGAGFVAELCDDDQLDVVTDGVVQTLLGHAPLSMWAAKEAIRRIRRANVPNGDDIVDRVFGSDDFHAAVAAFANKETVVWQGK
jgi:enoyl-CoA hydratase/carnithine racemase